jgi:hypothetical protein
MTVVAPFCASGKLQSSLTCNVVELVCLICRKDVRALRVRWTITDTCMSPDQSGCAAMLTHAMPAHKSDICALGHRDLVYTFVD